MKGQLRIGLIEGNEIFEVRFATKEELDDLNRQATIATDGNWGWAVLFDGIPVGKYEDGFEAMNPDWTTWYAAR